MHKDEPRVSVVIPTYQEGKYIGCLLRKISRINYPLEVIVVDSGSTDQTIETAKSFTEKVYKIDQRGIALARNYGAYRSNSEILIFLDADVTPPSDFVEKTVKTFHNPVVVGATCNINPQYPNILESIIFVLYNKLLRFFALFKPHSRGEFIAVRRKDFFKINGFNESLPCLEDHDFVLRVSKLGRFMFIANLSIQESMRRIRKLGMRPVLKTWFTNYLFYVVFKRTISKVWKTVR